jgi:hypothetical protein
MDRLCGSAGEEILTLLPKAACGQTVANERLGTDLPCEHSWLNPDYHRTSRAGFDPTMPDSSAFATRRPQLGRTLSSRKNYFEINQIMARNQG